MRELRVQATSTALSRTCAMFRAFAQSSRIMSLARSAIIKVGEFVLPEVIVGMIEASTTRCPVTPITRKRESTTASLSSTRPMLHVPTG